MAEQKTFETYDFEKHAPIKGYPELHWTGKRPFTSTQYFPAQLKERFGEEKRDWINKIFWGDNLQVMSHLLKDYRGKIDLIYIDPPYDSKADYKKKIQLKGKKIQTDSTSFEEKQYEDIWTNDEYLQFMFERLIILHELLSETGSIYVHIDWRQNSSIRLLMNEVFGPENYRNEIRWKRQPVRGAKATSSQYARNSDVILFYSKSSTWKWNGAYKSYDEKFIKEKFRPDNNGRLFRDSDLGDYSEESIKKFEMEGKIYITSSGKKRLIRYLDEEKGEALGDIWVDISEVNSRANERTDYPTQKPESLIERIIKASSCPDDLVFDCFMGSGTTQAVAMKLGRRFLGADINLGAIQTTTKRLLKVASELDGGAQQTLPEEVNEDTKYTGFEVYNVNNYDIFRNPVEARDLIIDALGIQKFDVGNVYDGELDGRMVKIMPINRIATKADLNELIDKFPYKTFENRKAASPTDPVEHITLVCMGHEPDLKATLEQELSEYKLDIEIVDLLRDKAELRFKHEAEADITIERGELVIKEFYPLNLMQKLSMQKEFVENWKQLVESVMIDWNYDGAVLHPSVIDVPEKEGLVKGRYSVPDDAGHVRVKITDLLSESLEMDVDA